MKSILQYVLLTLLLINFGCSEDTIDFKGTGKITGRVVKAESFDPIENAKVVLTPSNNTMFSDAEGYFTFEEVEAGDYSVSATKDGFLTGYEAATVSVGLEVNIVFEMNIETAGNKPPTTPVLVSPEDNSTNQDISVKLVWSVSDPDDDELTFKIRIKNSKNDDINLIEEVKDTFYTVNNLMLDTRYYWEISASDGINNEVWSSVNSFLTKETSNNRYLFVREENGNNIIYSMDDSGNITDLTDAGRNSWRPRKNLATGVIAFLSTENFETHIFTMNADGSNVKKVTTVPVEGFKQSELDFSWSANGAKLYYPNFDKLYEINKDGSGLTQIYQTPDGSFISECVMSYDGNMIALKTNNTNGYNVKIFTIDPSGNVLKTILSGVNGAAGGIDLSVDNKILLYTRDVSGFESSTYRQLDSRLFVYHMDTDTSEDISLEKVDGTIDIDPRLSPDEAKVIFVNTSNDGVSAKDIYTQNIKNTDNSGGVTFDRKLLVENALMPDWE